MSESNHVLLDVSGLKTYFFTDEGIVYALDDVSFTLDKGKSLGIVGESGSGKSVMAKTIMRLIPSPPGKIVGGSVLLHGRDLLKLSKGDMRKVRGAQIAMIFQEPMTSLNPVFTVGNQLREAIKLHHDLSRAEVQERAVEMMQLVRIPEPEKRLKQYPHQLSGGMRQRVMIAMALSCNPDLLICDEPTTALDVTIQAQILDLINEIQERTGTAIMMITHDFGVISEVSDEVLVMYSGKIMEHGTLKQVIDDAKHPYTEALLKSIPQGGERKSKLHVIEGMVPSLSNRPDGCLFHPRCDYATEQCKKYRPGMTELESGHRVRCFLYSDKKETEQDE